MTFASVLRQERRSGGTAGTVPCRTVRPPRRCISEEEAFDYLAGVIGEKRTGKLLDHIDDCAACRVLIGEAARALRPDGWEGQAESAAGLRTLKAGQVLSRRYEVVRFLARGGMGEVYEARTLNTRRPLAIKVPLLAALGEPGLLARFRREAALARRIAHPNVCRVWGARWHEEESDAGTSPGTPFLTMQLLSGESLASRLSRTGRLPQVEAAPLVAQAVAGLGAIHAAGLAHNDVKPQNMVLVPGRPERLVLIDFGLAGAATVVPPTVGRRAVGGTLHYLAPEQLQGGAVGFGVDLYAMGLVIFEMLTGEKPFRDDDPRRAALARLSGPPPAPSDLVHGLDPRWDDVVSSCLTHDPARRSHGLEHLDALAAGPWQARP